MGGAEPPDGSAIQCAEVRVGLVGWARPKAYPVLGEEPCRDTAYVLGMAEPAWCSRCGPPEREGKEGKQRRQEDEKEQEEQDTRRREEKREEGKKLGKMDK